MKHFLKALILHVACMAFAAGQNLDSLPALNGTSVDKANDKFLVRDASVSAAAGGLRWVTIADLVNVPSLFSSVPNSTFTLSKLAQSGATTGQVATWDGSAWAPATVSGVTAESVAAVLPDAIAEDVASAKGALKLDPYSTNLASQTFVFEGDSITAGSGTVSSTQTYAYLFSQSPFALGNGTYYNVAEGGSTIASGTTSGNNLTDQYATQVYPKRPTANGGTGGDKSYLFVMAGINEIRIGTSSATTIAALTAYTTQALADGFTVVVGTVLPYNKSYESNRLAVNAAILNGTVPASFVWDGSAILPKSTDTTYWQGDTLHPNATGQKQLAAALISAVYSRGAKNPNASVIASPLTAMGGIVSEGDVAADASTVSGLVVKAGTISGLTDTTKTVEFSKKVTFTPNATGWWRVATMGDLTVGNFRINESSITHEVAGKFHFWGGGSGDGSIAQTNSSVNVSHAITQARVTYQSGSAAFDIYVNSSGSAITVTFWGGQVAASTFVITSPPTGDAAAKTYTKSVTFDATKGLILTNSIKAIVPNYADDAAAGAGGLTTGDFYQTSGALKVKQ